MPRADDVCRASDFVASLANFCPWQGFSALLEPFYAGKSLTDPIDTAKVCASVVLGLSRAGTKLAMPGQMESSASFLEGQRSRQAAH